MFLLDSLMIAGIRWALETTITAAEAEMNDDSALRDQLLAAEMSREMGEISDDDFREIEADLLARIREIKERREGGSGPLAFGGAEPIESTGDSGFQVEASVTGDFHEPAKAPHTTIVETTPTHGNLFQTAGERAIEVLDLDRAVRSRPPKRSRAARSGGTTRATRSARTTRKSPTTRKTRTAPTTSRTKSRRK